MKNKTLKDSMAIVKFYETTRVFFNQHRSQLMDDYEVEMVRRPKEHQMDFEEYCLAVVHFMFKENTDKNGKNPLFKNESYNLMVYYQQNHKNLKKTWDKKCDDTLFEWTLTSYDRYKADMRGPLSLSSLNKKDND